MTTIGFIPADFRAQFPQFADPAVYSDATLTMYFNSAGNFISTVVGATGLGPTQQPYALYLMTAHIAGLAAVAASGGGGGIETSASIDKISVTTLAPPANSQFSWWLNQTPYGAQLLALLAVASVTGFYAGGRDELSGFRRGCGRRFF